MPINVQQRHGLIRNLGPPRAYRNRQLICARGKRDDPAHPRAATASSLSTATCGRPSREASMGLSTHTAEPQQPPRSPAAHDV